MDSWKYIAKNIILYIYIAIRVLLYSYSLAAEQQLLSIHQRTREI